MRKANVVGRRDIHMMTFICVYFFVFVLDLLLFSTYVTFYGCFDFDNSGKSKKKKKPHEGLYFSYIVTTKVELFYKSRFHQSVASYRGRSYKPYKRN